MDGIVPAWMAHEDLRLEPIHAGSVTSYLRDLSALAVRARAQGKMLLLWVSL